MKHIKSFEEFLYEGLTDIDVPAKPDVSDKDNSPKDNNQENNQEKKVDPIKDIKNKLQKDTKEEQEELQKSIETAKEKIREIGIPGDLQKVLDTAFRDKNPLFIRKVIKDLMILQARAAQDSQDTKILKYEEVKELLNAIETKMLALSRQNDVDKELE